MDHRRGGNGLRHGNALRLRDPKERLELLRRRGGLCGRSLLGDPSVHGNRIGEKTRPASNAA